MSKNESAGGGVIARIQSLQQTVGTAAQPFVLLALRIVFGYALFRAGWGKLGNLEQVEQAFSHLGIPMPGVNAVVVAVLEAAGGLLLMAGLATRGSSAVLIVVLLVAALTAHRAELVEVFANPGSLVGAAPVPYIAVLFVLGSYGAGRLSMDHVLARKTV